MNLWRIEDGKLKLKPHPGQAKAWNSTARFIFIIAGHQSGKTALEPWWLSREIERCGPGDYIAATASYDLFKLKLLPEMRNVFEHILGIGRYWAGNKIIEIRDPEKGFIAKHADDKMWGRIILRSSQSQGGLESTTANAAILDECGQDGFTLEDWEAVLRRLSLSQGRVLAGTTPYNLGWLKSEIFDQRDDPDIEVINFASTMNPAFPKAEFERARRKMQSHRFDMFYRGLFTRPVGLIYDYDDSLFCEPFPIPPNWERVIGVDFGGANQAFLHAAENPDTGIWYLYDEKLSGEMTTREHAAEQLTKLEGVESWQAVGGAPGETQQRRDFGQEGLSIYQPSVGDVEAGIDRVMDVIKSGKLRVFKTLTGLRDELGSYRRKVLPDGTVTDEIENKRMFHRIDCLRYMATVISDRMELKEGLMGYV